MPIVGGLDIHRKQITFDYLDTETGQVHRGQVSPADRAHLRGWLARFAGREDVAFALEGCAGWRYVAEELAAAGITAHLAEPADTAFARGRKRHAKTDKTDARHLRMLLAEGRLPECWIPPRRILECRALLELYNDLRRERTAWAQRIHAVLFHQGAPVLGEGALRTERGVAALRDAAAAHLSAAGQLQVATALEMIDLLDAQLHAVRHQLLDAARHLAGAKALAGRLYGVGPVTALAPIMNSSSLSWDIWRGGQCNFRQSKPLLSHVLTGPARAGRRPFVSQNTRKGRRQPIRERARPAQRQRITDPQAPGRSKQVADSARVRVCARPRTGRAQNSLLWTFPCEGSSWRKQRSAGRSVLAFADRRDRRLPGPGVLEIRDIHARNPHPQPCERASHSPCDPGSRSRTCRRRIDTPSAAMGLLRLPSSARLPGRPDQTRSGDRSLRSGAAGLTATADPASETGQAASPASGSSACLREQPRSAPRLAPGTDSPPEFRAVG
jgi:hypothetical protein